MMSTRKNFVGSCRGNRHRDDAQPGYGNAELDSAALPAGSPAEL